MFQFHTWEPQKTFSIFPRERILAWNKWNVGVMHLTLYAPTPQNDQTHSNNSSAKADGLFEFVDHFLGLAL